LATGLGTRYQASDILYLYSEYLGEADPAIDAAAIRVRADWIPGVVDAGANERNEFDGHQLFQTYANLGLHLDYINNAEESGIVHVWQRMSSGRLKVFPSVSKYLEERRLYRRDEKGRIVRDRDNLQDAVRCLVNGISHMRTKPAEVVRPLDDYVGGHGWMRYRITMRNPFLHNVQPGQTYRDEGRRRRQGWRVDGGKMLTPRIAAIALRVHTTTLRAWRNEQNLGQTVGTIGRKHTPCGELKVLHRFYGLRRNKDTRRSD
jgi:hypothetical protein